MCTLVDYVDGKDVPMICVSAGIIASCQIVFGTSGDVTRAMTRSVTIRLKDSELGKAVDHIGGAMNLTRVDVDVSDLGITMVGDTDFHASTLHSEGSLVSYTCCSSPVLQCSAKSFNAAGRWKKVGSMMLTNLPHYRKVHLRLPIRKLC